MNKSRNEHMLSGEYLVAYQKAELYFGLYSNFNPIDNQCLIEILDILSIAQESNQKISSVVGVDYKDFLSQIHKAYYPFSLAKFIYNIHMRALTFVVIMMLISSFLLTYLDFTIPHTNISLYLVMIMGFLFSHTMLWIMKKKKLFRNFELLKEKTIRRKKRFQQDLPVIMLILLVMWLPSFPWEVTNTVVWIAFLVSVIPGATLIILFMKKNGELKNSRSSKQALLDGFEKKYIKQNEKRINNGKNPWSDIDLANRLTRKLRVIDIVAPITIIIYLVLTFFLVNDQIEEGWKTSGVMPVLFCVAMIGGTSSVFNTRKHVIEFIYHLNKRNAERFKEGLFPYEELSKTIQDDSLNSN